MGQYQNFIYNVLRLGGKKGRPPVFSAQQFYPIREEKELQSQVAAEFARVTNEALAAALKGIADDMNDLTEYTPSISAQFRNNIDGMADRVIANAQNNLVKFTEMTIGRPYYPGALEPQIKADWVATFQQLCISAETDAKAKIAQIVATGKDQGMNKAQIEKMVFEKLPAETAHRAELITRTEVGKLNNSATMASYKGAGIEYYKWLSCIDDRTRATHAKLNGVICVVGQPDKYVTENESDPAHPAMHTRGSDMYIGEPGTDFQCRCTCTPWDPRIDGKFEIREAPAPAPKEPTKLEQARAETEAAKAEAEQARNEAEELNAKIEILRNAQSRQSKRTNEEILEIQKKWRLHNVKTAGIIPIEKKIVTEKDIQVIVDNYLSKYPKETVYNNLTIGTFLEKPINNGIKLMSANHNAEEIKFNTYSSPTYISTYDNLKNALNKIRTGDLLSFREEYMLESFYHEINHSKAKKWVRLNPHGQGDYKRTAMETINQFVSRHQYDEFIKRLGGVAVNKDEILRDGRGYSKWIKNLRFFIKEKKISEISVYKYFRKHLFDTSYNELDNILYVFFKKNSGTKKSKNDVLKAFEILHEKDFIKSL